jgi:hypothetical protein
MDVTQIGEAWANRAMGSLTVPRRVSWLGCVAVIVTLKLPSGRLPVSQVPRAILLCFANTC